MEQVRIPGPCPFLTRPTLVSGRVRDLSLTDFKGKFLFVLFYQEDFNSVDDLKGLVMNHKRFKQSDCEVLACSTESSLVHLDWVKTPKEDGGFGGSLDIPLVSDRFGELSGKLEIYDEEEGVCLRSVLIVDDKGIMRHLASTSLPIEDLIRSSLDTIKTLREVKLEKMDNCKVKEKGFLDKLWRKNLKIPDSPKSSLKRSLSSSSKIRARPAEKPKIDENTKKRSRSSSQSKVKSGSSVFPLAQSLAEEKADDFADTIIKSLKAALKDKFNNEIELPEYCAGEVTLDDGRVSGVWKVSRGGPASLGSRTDVLILTFPLLIRGMLACYSFKGRRVKGELACAYDRVVFNVKLSQRVRAEAGNCPQLVELSLKSVDGVRMDVHGFGPLNWIAGKKVTDLVQETVLQEVEDELKFSLEYQLSNLAFYFQIVESVSPNLTPVGIIVH
jgi:alkyl hydroperoxide reductase subunit AhpC